MGRDDQHHQGNLGAQGRRTMCHTGGPCTMRYCITTVALPHLSMEETVGFAAGLGYDGLELRVRRIPPHAHGQPYSFWGNHKNDLNPDNVVAQAAHIKE